MGGNLRGPKDVQKQLNGIRGAFLQNINAMEGFGTKAVQIQNPVNRMTQALQNQDLALKDHMRAMGSMNQMLIQQRRLRQSWLAVWRRDATGNITSADMIIPPINDKAINSWVKFRENVGLGSVILRSFGSELTKVGKNIQWAGRQLTVGLSVPLSILGTFAAKAAMEIDRELVRIVKVYNFTGERTAASMKQVKDESLATAEAMAEAFGIIEKETLDVTATFAQMGRTGKSLQEMTEMTLRIATLGEVDHQTALNLTRTTMDAFRLTTDETRATLDRFNQVENSTVLTLQDMAQELPQISGTLANFGARAEFGAAMLAAMKERGSDVNEAATALRFSMARLANPTADAAEHFERLGVNVGAMLSAGGEEALPNTLYALADSIFAVNNQTQRMQILGDIFGLRQADRMYRLFDAIRQGERDTGAFANALEAMGMSAGEAAQRADKEIQDFRNSASGQFKILVADIQSEFAEFGQGLLIWVNRIGGFFRDILTWFNDLSPGIKSFVTVFGGLIGIAGPLVMLGGLIANLVGHFFSLIGFTGQMATRFKLVSESSRAAELATRMNNDANLQAITSYNGLSTAASNASRAVASYAQVAQRAAAAQATSSGLLIANAQGNVVGRTAGQTRTAGAPMAPMPPIWGPQNTAAQAAARNITEPPKQAAQAWKNLGKVATGSLGAIIAGMLMLKTETGSWINNLITVSTSFLLINSLAGGKLVGTIGAVGKRIQSVTVAALSASTAATKIASGFSKTLALLAGPWGAGLLAAGLGVMALKKHVDNLEKSAFRARDGAQALAEAFGAEWHEGEIVLDETGKAVETVWDRAEKLKETNAELVEQFKQMDETTARRGFMLMGYELVQHGITPEEAVLQVEALMAATGNADLQIDLVFDPEAIDQQVRMVVEQARQAFESPSPSLGEALWNQVTLAPVRLNSEIKAMSTSLSDFLTDAIRSTDPKRIELAFNEIAEMFRTERDRILADTTMDPGYRQQMLDLLVWAEQDLISQLGQNLNVSGDVIDITQGLLNARRQLAEYSDSAALKAEAEYQRELAKAVMSGNQLTKSQQENLRASIYQKYGLEDLSESLRGAGADASDTAGDMQELTASQQDAADEARALAGAFRSSMGEAMQSGVDIALGVYDSQTEAANKSYEAQAKAADKSFDAQADASDKHFDRMQKNYEKSMDARIKAADKAADAEIKAAEKSFEVRIKNAENERDANIDAVETAAQRRIDIIQAEIDAENERDDTRQRVFDAERRRLSYYADQANRNVSLNFAMLGGDLEQAAILQAEARAAADQYQAELAQEEARRGMEERQNARKDSIDAIEAERNAAVEALKEEFEVLKESLQEQKEARLDALKEAKQNMQDRLRAERETRLEEIRASRDAAREQIDHAREIKRESIARAQERYQEERKLARDRFQKELEDYIEITPKTETEARKRFGGLSEIARDFGVKDLEMHSDFNDLMIRGYVDAWQDARRAVLEDKRWDKWAEDLADKAIKGFSGMTAKEYFKFLKSTGVQVTPAAVRQQGAYGANEAPRYHSGGEITPAGSFKGLKKDERPIVAQVGEYMMDRDTVESLGVDFFRALQKDPRKAVMSREGKMHAGGMVQALAAGHMSKTMTEALSALSLTSGGQLGTGKFERGGRWPPRAWGRISANTSAALRFALSQWDNKYGFSPATNRGDPRSDHSWGKAIDFMVAPLGRYAQGAQKALGWAIANYFTGNPGRFGTKYVIWDGKINSGGGWRPYTRYGSNPGPTLGHFDHPHVSFLHKGGLVAPKLPSLATGGTIMHDNTLANLHKGEHVLTAPLSNQLEQGIRNIDQSRGDVTVIVNAQANHDANQIARKVVEIIEGPTRRIGKGIQT